MALNKIMKFLEQILVLKTPFNPNWSFKKLKASNQKISISIFSILITLSFLLLFYYLQYSKEPQHLSFSFQAMTFSIGFIFKVILIGIVVGILTSKIYNTTINLKESISIISVSTLPLVIGSALQYFTNSNEQTFGIVGTLIFGVISSFGFNIFFESKMTKSLIIMLGIILIVKFLEITFLGMPITYK